MYLKKQKKTLRSGVSLVEIDLLRGGTHTTAIPIERLRSIAQVFDYHICTTVIGDPTHHHVKPFAMRDALPTIVVPLDPGIPAVKVKLQPLFDRAYDTGRYSRLAKYDRKTPEPTLTPEQQQWADTIQMGRN